MILHHLMEANAQEVAIIFGRFNPPHKGHRAAWEMAAQSPVWYVGTNKSTQGPKDPLPFDVKIKAMAAIWPEVASHIVAETSWLTLASKVYEKHGDVVLNLLTDEEWVSKTVNQYNGVEGPHGLYKFSKIVTKPTPRLSSATALRDAVIKGDRKAFADAAGVSADTKVAGVPFFDLVAQYLLPYQDKPKKKVKEARKSAWDRMMAAVPELAGTEKRSQDAIAGIKKANQDYQDILDREKATKEDIRKVKGGYRLVSKKSGKNLGTYPTRAGAEKRERQVQYFKHMKEGDDLNVQFHDELNPAIWQDGKMRPDVRANLLKIAEDFKDSLGIRLEGLKDITVSGSNAAYSYTPKSDIDLHLVADIPEADEDNLYRELFDAKKYQYNTEHDYKIRGYDVELYVQDANQPHVSQGIYSVMHDEWIKEPAPVVGGFDKEATMDKYNNLKELIKLAIKSENFFLADKLRLTIKKYRQTGLHATGEFGPENLAFKALRANGYLEKLYQLLNDLKDKSLSIHESKAFKNSMSGQEMLEYYDSCHHAEIKNQKMKEYVLENEWVLDSCTPEDLPTAKEYADDAFGRDMKLDMDQVREYMEDMADGEDIEPIIMGPDKSVIDGNHRAQAARKLNKTIECYRAK